MAIGTPVAGTAATLASAATTINVPYPASPVAGDVLLMEVTTSSATLTTLPGGWTSGVNARGTGSQSPTLLVCVKYATGSESGSLAVTIASATANARMWKISGVDQTTILDVAGTTVSPAAATTLNIPTLTTGGTGRLLWVAGASAGPSGTWTQPSSPAAFTKEWETTVNIPSTSGNWLIWSGSGATGTVTLTRSTSLRSVGGMIALRPAADPVVPRNIRTFNPALSRSFTW